MKLAIGTAQFGLKYGISNTMGQTTQQEADSIINYAVKNNILYIDTAREYAESENILGKIIQDNNLQDTLRIITKVSKDSKIQEDILKSLSSLNIKKIYGLLIHDTKSLLSFNGKCIYRELIKAKNDGLVDKIGVTVYTPEETREILKKFNIDIIQFPCSISDQRFPSCDIIEKLKFKNVEIYVRSIFLQGLYFLNSKNMPSYFKPIENKILAIDEIANDLGVSKLKLLIDYIKSIDEIDNIVVGVNNLQHMKDIIEAYNDDRYIDINYSKFAIMDDNFTNISKWRI